MGVFMQDFCLNLDWLGFTFRPSVSVGLSPFRQFQKMFPEFDYIIDNSSRNRIRSHYDVTLSWGNEIIIAYNVFDGLEFDNESVFDNVDTSVIRRFNQGVNVQVPSHSLELFFNLFGLSVGDDDSLLKMFSILKHRSCKLSRIDLCFDDYTKKYTPDDYNRFYATGRLQSKYINSYSYIGSRSKGSTVYFGSLSHRRKLLRIYDKSKQSNGEIDSIRYEWEFHGEGANDLFCYLLDNYTVYVPFSTFVLEWVRVKVENDNTTNISLVKDDKEWFSYIASFIPVCDGLSDDVNSQFNAILIPIRVPHVKSSSLSGLNYFVEYQAAPSITGYVDLYGLDALLDLIRKSRSSGRVNPKYQEELIKLRGSTYFEHIGK